MENASNNTEQNILRAAREVFTHKGYDGARMRDIAAAANINISMLHYYYRSKDNLFELVFKEVIDHVYGRIFTLIASDKSLFEKIEEVVSYYIDTMATDPILPNFIFNEITRYPQRLISNVAFHENIRKTIEKLRVQTEYLEQEGVIGHIDLMEFMMDIDSRCIFPFITRPLWQNLFAVEQEDYDKMLLYRKKFIVNSVIESLRKK